MAALNSSSAAKHIEVCGCVCLLQGISLGSSSFDLVEFADPTMSRDFLAASEFFKPIRKLAGMNLRL
jgi:hypothetical protein